MGLFKDKPHTVIHSTSDGNTKKRKTVIHNKVTRDDYKTDKKKKGKK